MNKRFRHLWVGILVMALLLASCTAQSVPGPQQAPPADGKGASEVAELRVALGQLPASLHPHMDVSLLSIGAVFSQIFDSLLIIGDDGQPQPALAESYKLIDPLTWELKLRKDVVFHNGEPLNAETIKWNVKFIKDPESKSRRAPWFSTVSEVQVIDDYTVRLITARPMPDLPYYLAATFVLPPRYYQQAGANFGQSPVGSGPYKLAEYVRDERLVLEQAADSWREAGPVRKLVFLHTPEDATRVASLEAGEVDVAYALPLEHVARLEQRGHTVSIAPTGQSFIVQMRQPKGGPIADKRVRQALSYAVNTDAIISQLLLGRADKLQGQYVASDAFGFNPAVKAYSHDKQKARQLLSEAGYASGLELVLTTSSGRYLKDLEVAQALLSQFADVGVTIKLEVLESAVWLDKLFNAGMGDLYIIGFNYAQTMNASPQLVSYTCANNTRSFCDPALDKLYSDQTSEMDQAARERKLQAMIQRIHDDPVALYLFRIPGVYGLGKDTSGITFNAYYGMDLSGVRKGK